jgi:hypothetical protein
MSKSNPIVPKAITGGLNKPKSIKNRRVATAMRRVELCEEKDLTDDDLKSHSPIGTSFYHSFDLQSELDKIKTTRKMFGAQWLLSSPKLNSTLQMRFEQKTDQLNGNNLLDRKD